MFEKGFFNGAFDFNRDGKLDAFERAADFAAFQQMMDENEKEDDDNLPLFDDEDEEYEDEFDEEDEYEDDYDDEDFETDDSDF